jgi:amidase
MGSVRIPAACCGLVGIKPGRGVVPSGIGPSDWFGLAEHGILATTVADATLGFSVLAGQGGLRLVEPDRLRVAVSLRSPVAGVFPDGDSRRAAGTAARLLVRLGHDAVRADPKYPPAMGVKGLATWFAAAYQDAEAAGVDTSALQRRTRRHLALGSRLLGTRLVRGEDRAAWRERCRDWFADGRFDILVTPALATAPPVATDWHNRSWRANMLSNLRYAPYAAPWNVAGFPGVVVPMGTRTDGLPTAVQLVGPPGSELTLLAVAGQLEAVSPWRRHAPGWPRARAHSRVA